MAEIGIPPHIVEAVLTTSAETRAGVAGIYNRAKYSAEKKAALKRWAAHVDGLVAGRPANVLALHGKAGAQTSRRDTGPWQAPRNDAGWKKQRRRIIAALDAQVDREYALAEKTFIDYQNQLSEADHDNFSDL